MTKIIKDSLLQYQESKETCIFSIYKLIKILFYTFEKTSVLKKQKTALVCPLNWGLGHATRIIPIIQLLLKYKIKVMVAADGHASLLLKKEFPELEFITLKGYEVRFSATKTQLFKMAVLSVKIIYHTFKEHQELKKIIKKNNIRIVLSDNRFGLWGKKVYSIFISHQLQLHLPKAFGFINYIYQKTFKYIVSHYNECWTPDLEGDLNLAGKLSHPKYKLTNLKYIGILSRFCHRQKHTNDIKTIDVLFILSGPEPQRSIFEKIIYEQTKGKTEKIVLVRGTEKISDFNFSFPVYNLLPSQELEELISQSNLIVCRPGYSSVMDLVALGKNALLIPTPGQTEQEYLASHLEKNKLFNWSRQDKFKYEMIFEVVNDNNTGILRHSFVEKEISRLSEL